MAHPYLSESIWFDKHKFDDAERQWVEHSAKNNLGKSDEPNVQSKIVQEISRIRQFIKNSLQTGNVIDIKPFGGAENITELNARFQKIEEENIELRKLIQEMQAVMTRLECRVSKLETLKPPVQESTKVVKSQPPAKQESKDQKSTNNGGDDDDIDLFGSDEEDDGAAEKLREQRLKEYEEKKSKKKTVIAKSSVILDVKPWDDETDMKEMEKKVREIKEDGLLWGASKLVPLAYGIKKLQICCVVEDDKISIDWLQETIESNEDLVQSVDVAAFNKL